MSLAALPVACAGAGSGGGAEGGRGGVGYVQDDAGGMDLRIMTYNLRYGTAADGPDAWERRRGLALRVIAEERPAIVGVQEALRFQLDEIAAGFPRLGEVGVGRDDGREAGEYAAILYDIDRFSVLESDTFWLSDTPRTVASTSWGNSIPRIVTWARWRDRRTDRTLYVYNTHWDHQSQPSRVRSAELLLERIAGRTHPDDPVLLTGDFNAGERNPAFTALVDGGLTDAFRAVHPAATEVGTFHGFEGNRSGEKIDAVLASAGWRVRDARIVTLNEDGRYPSDHFPVMAVVSYPEGS